MRSPADTYSFTADQRQQLAELLEEENRSMWESILNGISFGGAVVGASLGE